MEHFKSGLEVFGKSAMHKPLLHGLTTGSYHNCSMAGCTGVRLSVKWDDGKHSFPCTKGMTLREVKIKKKIVFQWWLG